MFFFIFLIFFFFFFFFICVCNKKKRFSNIIFVHSILWCIVAVFLVFLMDGENGKGHFWGVRDFLLIVFIEIYIFSFLMVFGEQKKNIKLYTQQADNTVGECGVGMG